MKTLEEKIKVMQAALEGKPIEFLGSCDDWRPMNTACAVWNWYSCDYRIALGHPDEIDWSAIEENWKYMARDKDGMVRLYESTPVKDCSLKRWCGGSSFRRIDGLIKGIYKRGDRPWGESLIERPSNK